MLSGPSDLAVAGGGNSAAVPSAPQRVGVGLFFSSGFSSCWCVSIFPPGNR